MPDSEGNKKRQSEGEDEYGNSAFDSCYHPSNEGAHMESIRRRTGFLC